MLLTRLCVKPTWGIIRLLRSDDLLPRWEQVVEKVMPDDHSKLVPPLPIPNRTVKQLCADDSAATSVKVGYRHASYSKEPPSSDLVGGFFTSFEIYWLFFSKAWRLNLF